MNSLFLFIIPALLFGATVWVGQLWAQGFKNRRHGLVTANNIAEGTHTNAITKLTDAAIGTRFLLVKFGSDGGHIAVADAADKPLGICSDEAEAKDEAVAVQFLVATNETRKCVASEAIALTDDLYVAAGGKVSNLPTVPGTYWKVGRPLQTAAADGDVLEFESHAPVTVVVPD